MTMLLVNWFALTLSLGFLLSARGRYKAEAARNEALTVEYQPVLDQRKIVGELENQYSILKKAYTEALQLLMQSEKYLTAYSLGIGTTDEKLYVSKTKPVDSAILKAVNQLSDVASEIKIAKSNGTACVCEYLGENIYFNESRARANQLFKREIKLRLRCLDNEFKRAAAVIDWNNVNRVIAQCKHYFIELNKSGEHLKTVVQSSYFELKMKELLLSYEIQVAQKEKAEKEAAERRAEREAELEEARLKADIERATRDRLKLEALIAKELESALPANSERQLLVEELERQLLELKEREKRAISMAQKTKAGFVYVISNPKSFSSKICKIGMTRRLDPYERVKELGDASVPDFFDVHAYAYSENAPKLEKDLHEKFSEYRVNLVNQRKEFFFVDPRDVVSHLGSIAKGVELQVLDA